MRLGIQFKLVATLVLAGLLPLLVSLAVLMTGVVQLRVRSVGQALRSTAQQQADHVATLLSAQIEFTWLLTQLPSTTDVLRAGNERGEPTTREIDEIEKRWPDMSPADPVMSAIMDNPLSRRWKAIQARQPRFAEVMITDAHGRLVAATNKTSDYYQADEQWWQNCYADGQGRVFLSDVAWDASAINAEGTPGSLVASLCMPIYSDDAGKTGASGPSGSHVAGVLKASFDATWLVRQLDVAAGGTGYTYANLWLVAGDGKPLPGAVQAGALPELPVNIVNKMKTDGFGWLSQTDIPGRGMLAFANVRLPLMAPHSSTTGKPLIDQPTVRWFVIVTSDRDAALAPVYRISSLILSVGLVLIGTCFLAGLWIARRALIRPLVALTRGVSELERGNVDYRLPLKNGSTPDAPTPGNLHVFRDDEVGELARNFNYMADRLRDNIRHLSQTDAMKQRFLDLASHELRTPLTYLLGMLSLASRRGTVDPDMLQNLTSKAQRLNHIVENMLKLAQQPGFGSSYAKLNLSSFALGPLVGLVLQELLRFLQERGLNWEIDVPEELPKITADYDKIRDVMLNLLTNAIRFSPDGATVQIAVARQGTDELMIKIIDHGPGMSAEQVERVTKPFSAADESLMTHTSGGAGGELSFGSRGMGLGLSVARRFVDMHGGTLTLDTAPGRGTTVNVVLPLTAKPSTERETYALFAGSPENFNACVLSSTSALMPIFPRATASSFVLSRPPARTSACGRQAIHRRAWSSG